MAASQIKDATLHLWHRAVLIAASMAELHFDNPLTACTLFRDHILEKTDDRTIYVRDRRAVSPSRVLDYRENPNLIKLL